MSEPVTVPPEVEEEVRQHRRTRRFRTGLTLLVLVAFLVVAVDYAWEAVTGDDPEEPTVAACPSELQPDAIPPAFPLPAREVPVEVLNAAGRGGLAGSVAEQLRRRGFDIRGVGNEPAGRILEGVAELRYGPRGYGRALTLLAHFPGARLVEDTRRTRLVGVALGRSFESIASEAQWKQAYRREVPLGCGATVEPSPSPSPAPG